MNELETSFFKCETETVAAHLRMNSLFELQARYYTVNCWYRKSGDASSCSPCAPAIIIQHKTVRTHVKVLLTFIAVGWGKGSGGRWNLELRNGIRRSSSRNINRKTNIKPRCTVYRCLRSNWTTLQGNLILDDELVVRSKTFKVVADLKTGWRRYALLYLRLSFR